MIRKTHLKATDRVEHAITGQLGTVELADNLHVRVRWDNLEIGLLYHDPSLSPKARHLLRLSQVYSDFTPDDELLGPLFGDLVAYHQTTGYVIGEPTYSKNGSHIMMADEGYVGMAVAVVRLRNLGRPNPERAFALRKRYLLSYPHALLGEVRT